VTCVCVSRQVSHAAKEFIKVILERNVATRLGSTSGAIEIRKHEFFAPLDWDRVSRKEYEPEFRPPVLGDASTASNFDAEFTSEKVISTIVS